MTSLKSVHSWVYPQSSLPPAVISALALAGTEGGMLSAQLKVLFYRSLLAFLLIHFLISEFIL